MPWLALLDAHKEKGEGHYHDPLLRLQTVKRLAITYHNHNRDCNCGEGAEMWGIKKSGRLMLRISTSSSLM
jgi:hypothetical protein